jgi:hypothetical protein
VYGESFVRSREKFNLHVVFVLCQVRSQNDTRLLNQKSDLIVHGYYTLRGR